MKDYSPDTEPAQFQQDKQEGKGRSVFQKCGHCAAGNEPEWSFDAIVLIHRLPRLDRVCLNPIGACLDSFQKTLALIYRTGADWQTIQVIARQKADDLAAIQGSIKRDAG